MQSLAVSATELKGNPRGWLPALSPGEKDLMRRQNRYCRQPPQLRYFAP